MIMNYYVQGDAAKAQQIKATFEKLGYDISWPEGFANPDVINIGVERNDAKYVVAETSEYIKNIIKTHPDYKELELPVESKFKVGDWLVYKDGNTFAGGFKAVQVQTVEEINRYTFTHNTNSSCNFIDRNCRLWTIADAKDGDVLATDGIICIFKKLDKDGYYIISHCIYTVKDGLEVIDYENDSIGSYGFKPATKEDRELLFRKIKEAGYQWDADKKELKKIQPHYDISNFKPFDKVLVRDNDRGKWRASIFSYHIKGKQTCYPFCCIGNSFSQCIPYEGNEHLFGTTDMCDERFINW